MGSDLKISDGRTLSEKVAQELERTILKEMTPGDRLLPEPSLAEKFGVSRGTIRNSLKILEDAALITRQKKRGTIVTPRAGIKTLSLIFPGSEHMFLDSGYIAPVFAGMTSKAAKYQIDVVFNCSNTRWGSSKADDVEKLIWKDIDGMLVYEEFSDEFLQALSEYKNQVVVVDNDATRFGLTSIVFDNREAGRLAARKLVEAGHTSLAFFGEISDHGIGTDPAYLERFEGFSSEVLKLGVSLSADAVFDFPRGNPNDSKMVDTCTDVILKQGITGAFDVCGYGPLQVRERMAERGETARFSTLGIRTIARTQPKIMDKAAVSLDGYALGAESVEALRNLLTGDETPGLLKTVAPGFIESESGL